MKVAAVDKLDNGYRVRLVDEEGQEKFSYCEETKEQLTNKGDWKRLKLVSSVGKDGKIKKIEYEICEIQPLKIERLEKEGEKFVYTFSTGWSWGSSKKYEVGSSLEFIVKACYNEEGISKEKQKRKLELVDGSNSDESKAALKRELYKMRAETELQKYNTEHRTKGVASYLYDSLLKNPLQKMAGERGLINTVDRKYYREELEEILKTQRKYHAELQDDEIYKVILETLYPKNKAHREERAKHGLSDFIVDDVLFYQRPLKSKKQLIADCPYEKTLYRDSNGDFQPVKVKVAHKSNPYFQEFGIWNFIHNLRIIQDGCDVTTEKVDKEVLFEALINRKEVGKDGLLKILRLSPKEYNWNYDDDYKQPCNETRSDFQVRLQRIKGFPVGLFLSAKSQTKLQCTNEYLLWHFFYSVKKETEFKTGLKSLIKLTANAIAVVNDKENNENKNAELITILNNSKQEVFGQLKTFGGYPRKFAAYSEKALKKLFPLMRVGKFWHEKDIDEETKKRIADMLNGQYPSSIHEKVKAEIQKNQQFCGLSQYMACSIVYVKEHESVQKTSESIRSYLKKNLKHGSLRNPVVENVLRETLLLVGDIVDCHGMFDCVHIELGRSLKKTAKQRQKEVARNRTNRRTNEWVRKLLKELKKEYPQAGINENSISHQDKMKILEEDVLSFINKGSKNAVNESEETSNEITKAKKEIEKIRKKKAEELKDADIERYLYWWEQCYRSPYTGKIIKLSELFNHEKYQVDHIFPQARITLDASCNKVICEANINQEKGDMTGMEFVTKRGGKESGVLTVEEYRTLVDKLFIGEKKRILLSPNIPADFTNSQRSNMQYVTRTAMKMLSSIVRDEVNDAGDISKNCLPVAGGVTARLRNDWGLNKVWDAIIAPRFKRLNFNEEWKTDEFGKEISDNGHTVFQPSVPESCRADFDKKRIDHRNHALDALVVALATPYHVAYINNESSDQNERHGISSKYMSNRTFRQPLCYREAGKEIRFKYSFGDKTASLSEVVQAALEDVIISFKQQKGVDGVIRQRSNKYKHWDDEKQRFDFRSEEDLKNKAKYCVRQALHKETFYGLSEQALIPIKDVFKYKDEIGKRMKKQIQEYESQGKTRKEIIEELQKKEFPPFYVKEQMISSRGKDSLLVDWQNKKDEEIHKLIGKVADVFVQRILRIHFKKYKEKSGSDSHPFSYIGIQWMNEHMEEYCNELKKDASGSNTSEPGKRINHKPIYKVKMLATKGNSFPVSEDGNSAKNKRYVISAEGSNMLLGVFQKNGKRYFKVPTLREIVNRKKHGVKDLFGSNENDGKLLFVLSPGDLVYVPTEAERMNKNFDIKDIKSENIYRYKDASGSNGDPQVNFTPYYIATLIPTGRKEKEKEKEIKEITLTTAKGKQQKPLSFKSGKAKEDYLIKDVCWKIEVNRLGRIVKLIKDAGS